MTKNEVLQKIYRLVKENFGDNTSVTLFANSEGIHLTETDQIIAVDRMCSMRKINGEWCETEE